MSYEFEDNESTSAGWAVNEGFADEAPSAPDPSPDREDRVPDPAGQDQATEVVDSSQSQTPSWLMDPNFSRLPGLQQQGQPQAGNPQQTLAQLQYAQHMEEQLVAAHAAHMDPQSAQWLYAQHQAATQQRNNYAQQLALQMQQAALEPTAKEIVVHRLVEEMQKHNPNLNMSEAREFIGDFGDGPSMIQAAQKYLRMQQGAAMDQRKSRGTDRMGGSGPNSTRAPLTSKSPMQWITEHYADRAASRR